MTHDQQIFLQGAMLWPAIWFILKLPGWAQRLVDKWIERGELVTREDVEKIAEALK